MLYAYYFDKPIARVLSEIIFFVAYSSLYYFDFIIYFDFWLNYAL